MKEASEGFFFDYPAKKKNYPAKIEIVTVNKTSIFHKCLYFWVEWRCNFQQTFPVQWMKLQHVQKMKLFLETKSLTEVAAVPV